MSNLITGFLRQNSEVLSFWGSNNFALCKEPHLFTPTKRRAFQCYFQVARASSGSIVGMRLISAPSLSMDHEEVQFRVSLLPAEVSLQIRNGVLATD